MSTDTALVAFVSISMGGTGVISLYHAELVAEDDAPVVAGDDVPAVVKEDASVAREDGAPAVGERVVMAPAVDFGKAGQTKSLPFSASK